MSIEKCETKDTVTVFYIYEPGGVGEQGNHRVFALSHESDEILKIPRISIERVENPVDDCGTYEQFETYTIEGVGIIVFQNIYDKDWETINFNPIAHYTQGPFLVL